MDATENRNISIPLEIRTRLSNGPTRELVSVVISHLFTLNIARYRG